jgi:hypothetical protein
MRVDAIRWSAGVQTTPLSVLLGGTGRPQVRLVSVPPTETPPALLRSWQAPGQQAGSSSAHDPAR